MDKYMYVCYCQAMPDLHANVQYDKSKRMN